MCSDLDLRSGQGHKVTYAYVHYASHDLNLALIHAAKVPTVFIMMENLSSLGRFFAFSPKRGICSYNDSSVLTTTTFLFAEFNNFFSQ